MKRIVFILSIFTLFSCKTLQAQPPQNSGGIGSVKTEQYQAEFEKKQSITDVAEYTDTIQVPIQLLKIGINEELYELYPELKDKRVGLGVTNIVIEYLEYTGRFVFTEEKEDIKQRMIAQDKASDKGISVNKIDVKGISNQKSSGRCWLFAGLNILRPVVMEKYDLEEFEFSQNFLFFYDNFNRRY